MHIGPFVKSNKMLKRLTIAILLILNAPSLHALTLGQIHVDSFINQPLKATIDIEDVKGDELSALRVKLAPRVDFRNAGVEWHSHLEELRFSLIQTNRGPAIRVTSRKAVKEPFLSFVIDANWAKGKIAKDYTLLLDPPLYTGASAAPVEMADAGSLPAERQAPLAQQQQQSAPQSQEQPLPVESPTAASPSTAKTMTGSSLWQVASKVRPQAATMQQTMVAIHEENPEAFMRGNMNLLKKGEMLRIPSAEVIAGIPQGAAVTRVARHQKAMRTGKAIASAKRLSPEIVTLAQGTQPQASAAEPAAATGESVGRLRLESASDAVEGEVLASGSATQNSELSAGASVVDENRALKSRVKVLEEQLRVARKLIQMKGELAQLQQLYRQLDEQNAQQGADQEMLALAERQLLADAEAATAADTGEAPPLGAVENAVDAPLSATREPAPAGQQAPDAEADALDDSDETVSAAVLTAEEQSLLSLAPELDSDGNAVEQEMAVQNAAEPPKTIAVVAETEGSALSSAAQKAGGEARVSSAESPAAVESPPENQAQEQAAEDSAERHDSLIEGIDNNLLLGAGGIALVGLLLLLLLGRLGNKRGRARDSQTMEAQLVGETVGETPAEARSNDYRGASVDAQQADIAAQSVTAPQDLAASPLAAGAGDSQPPHSPPGREPEALDALDFANALVRSGERAQAREVLVQAIAADPQRADTNMRLMELLHAEKDRHAFEARMHEMQRHGFDDDAKLWQKIERMHADLLPAGVGSLGIVNQQKARAEVIDLHADSEAERAEKQHRLIIEDQDEADSSVHHDAELEDALRAFEQQLEDSGSKSGELLTEAGEALDDAAEILNNPLTSAIPDARIVDDLELDEELQVDESRGGAEQAEVITLDDSFGIDSHIKDEFDDLMTRGSAAERVERQFQDDYHGESSQAAPHGAPHSVTSFAAGPASLKQAEADAKIDLAAAFAEMGDQDGARDILAEVMAEGGARQRQAAQEMLKKLS